MTEATQPETDDGVPPNVAEWIGESRYPETADFPVERGYIWTSCASVENGNPLFWDDDLAAKLTEGPIAPPTTLSLWFRPHAWEPGETSQRLPLQVHFDLKDQLDLPEAVMSDSEVVFGAPVRPGDVISTSQVLRSITPLKTTKLGTGRFWVIDVQYHNQDRTWVGTEIFTGFGYQRAERPQTTSKRARPTGQTDERWDRWESAGGSTAGAKSHGVHINEVTKGDALPLLEHPCTATTVVLGALATRDWRPQHHDVDFAVHRNGAKNIFLNTPNQQAWFERYVTDWAGPRGRLGRMQFRMHDSVYPGDTMLLIGEVTGTGTDEGGCAWADLDITLYAQAAGEPRRPATTCTVRIALPNSDDPADKAAYNPWQRAGDAWAP